MPRRSQAAHRGDPAGATPNESDSNTAVVSSAIPVWAERGGSDASGGRREAGLRTFYGRPCFSRSLDGRRRDGRRSAWRREGGWIEPRHHLAHHRLVVAVEAREIVAAERILQHIQQALVTVGAGAWGPVVALLEQPDQVVVGDQGPRDRDRIAGALLDRLPDDGSGLEAPGAEDRDLRETLLPCVLPEGLPDRVSVRQVD